MSFGLPIFSYRSFHAQAVYTLEGATGNGKPLPQLVLPSTTTAAGELICC
ncbi:MAG: hypothetical protein AB1489_42885 [Acidobacteriota bacterium]